MKYDDETREVFEQLWWAGSCCAWVLLMFGFVANALSQGRVFGALVCLAFAAPGCKWVKTPAFSAAKWHFMWAKNRADQRGKAQFESKIEHMTYQNQEDKNRAAVARWKSEIISTYLGTIDGYLRVLSDEADSSRRIVTLQSAYSKFMALKAECAAGEVPQEVLSDRTILDHAKATSDEMTRLGFGEDRLNREIIRLFNLNAQYISEVSTQVA